MTHEEQLAVLRRAALQALLDCGAYLLPDPQLVTAMQLSVTPPPTQLECEQQVRWLEAQRFIAGITPPLGGSRRWKITDLGRTMVP